MKPYRKWLLLAVILGLVAVFFVLDLKQYLTLDYLKSQQAALDAELENHPLRTMGIFVLIYVATTALSIPGATVLTLAGAALFGFWLGLALVSFSSTVGATLAFLISRFVLRESIEKKFPERLKSVNEGMRREGWLYLLSLRFLPIFPFWLVNLIMGVTQIKTWQFFAVSMIGMLPGTMVFVNAGTQLGQIQSTREILSAEVLVSLLMLGIFPLIGKAVFAAIKRRTAMSRFKKPARFDYNIVVIGAGAGGLVSSYLAATLKAKVVLIEKHKMGGDCLNTGCVPSKALLKTAAVLSEIRRHREFGIKHASAEFDFADVMARVRKIIDKVAPHDSIDRYTRLGVECVTGEARIRSPFEVEVNGRVLTTKNIIVAAGGSPRVPAIAGLANYYTSDTIWNLKTLPRRLLVLGGGPIGCELALAFQRLGSQVTQVERGQQLMGSEDEDVAREVEKKFRREGVQVLLGHDAERFEGKTLVCRNGVRVEFDEVLVALGRQANVKGFGLKELGVKLARAGTIEADEFLRTSIPNIYVCGDIVGPLQFTHFSSHQAGYAALNALFSPFKSFKADYRVIPRVTYVDPEVARVGLNEREAQGVEYEVTRYGIDDLDRAIAEDEDHGFVKVLTQKGSDRILGVTIVGARAGEILAEFTLAMKWGLGLNKILNTTHPYPTFSEANKYVAGQWKRARAPQKALEFLGKFHTWRRG